MNDSTAGEQAVQKYECCVSHPSAVVSSTQTKTGRRSALETQVINLTVHRSLCSQDEKEGKARRQEIHRRGGTQQDPNVSD